jgi:hypothetical protein
VFTLTYKLAHGDMVIQTTNLKNQFNLIDTKHVTLRTGVEHVYIGNSNGEAELCEAYLHNGFGWVRI